MRDRDLFLLGFVGIGAYTLYKNETNKITSVIDSVSVPLTYTSNTINKAVDNFNSTYNSITKTLKEYTTPKPPNPLLTIMPIPNAFFKTIIGRFL